MHNTSNSLIKLSYNDLHTLILNAIPSCMGLDTLT